MHNTAGLQGRRGAVHSAGCRGEGWRDSVRCAMWAWLEGRAAALCIRAATHASSLQPHAQAVTPCILRCDPTCPGAQDAPARLQGCQVHKTASPLSHSQLYTVLCQFHHPDCPQIQWSGQFQGHDAVGVWLCLTSVSAFGYPQYDFWTCFCLHSRVLSTDLSPFYKGFFRMSSYPHIVRR